MSSRASTFARAMNVVLGAWLVVSVFLWPHLPASRESTAIGGALCALVALVATRVPRAHWLNAAVALALFATVWLVPHAHRASEWNDAVTAFFILPLALVPGAGETDGPPAVAHRVRA